MLPRAWIVLFLNGLILTACASPPRDDALLLARTGEQTTAAVQQNLQMLSTAALRQSEVNAFLTTAKTCRIRPDFCQPVTDSPELLEERLKFVQLIKLRTKALQELNSAYGAFRMEAEYDAESDLETALGELSTSANAYAAVASVPLSAAFAVLPRAGGLWARRRQKERLRAANELIGGATKIMSAALEREEIVFTAFMGDWSKRESEMRILLIEAGLNSRSDVLMPLLEDLGTDLVADSERTLSDEPALARAVEALAIARAELRATSAVQAYAAAARALENLSEAHRRFDSLSTSDFDSVEAALAELAGAAEDIDAALSERPAAEELAH